MNIDDLICVGITDNILYLALLIEMPEISRSPFELIFGTEEFSKP